MKCYETRNLALTPRLRRCSVVIIQHIKEDESSVQYFVIGCANYVNHSQRHADQVKESYVKFFWADESKNGGFASFDVSSTSMVVTMVDSTGGELHNVALFPRSF